MWNNIKQINWKIFIIHLIFWLTTEFLLNIVGIDDLADYSEFIFERHSFHNFTYICIVYSQG